MREATDVMHLHTHSSSEVTPTVSFRDLGEWDYLVDHATGEVVVDTAGTMEQCAARLVDALADLCTHRAAPRLRLVPAL